MAARLDSAKLPGDGSAWIDRTVNGELFVSVVVPIVTCTLPGGCRTGRRHQAAAKCQPCFSAGGPLPVRAAAPTMGHVGWRGGRRSLVEGALARWPKRRFGRGLQRRKPSARFSLLPILRTVRVVAPEVFPHLAPLRRRDRATRPEATTAKLCRAAGGEIEQIRMLLGHASSRGRFALKNS